MCTRKKSLDAILGSGIFLMISGIVLLFCFAFDVTPNMLIGIPIVITLAGALFLFFSYTKKRLVWTFFMGYFLTLSGIFTFVICPDSFALGRELWPVYVMLCSLAFLIASFQVKRRFSVSSLVTSIILLAFGGLLLCFSLHVISVPFRIFIAKFWPGFLVLLGIALIIIYTYMQRSNAAIKLENEVIADSDDED